MINCLLIVLIVAYFFLFVVWCLLYCFFVLLGYCILNWLLVLRLVWFVYCNSVAYSFVILFDFIYV